MSLALHSIMKRSCCYLLWTVTLFGIVPHQSSYHMQSGSFGNSCEHSSHGEIVRTRICFMPCTKIHGISTPPHHKRKSSRSFSLLQMFPGTGLFSAFEPQSIAVHLRSVFSLRLNLVHRVILYFSMILWVFFIVHVCIGHA